MKTTLFTASICIILLYGSCAQDDNKKIIQKNEAIAISFIESLNSHNADKLALLFAEQCFYKEVASGRSYSNRQSIAAYIGSTIAGIPDLKFAVVNILANDSLAVVEWIWKGTNSVGWADMGIPATNKYFELMGISIMEIENGLIKRNSDYWDWNSFIKGIGAEQ